MREAIVIGAGGLGREVAATILGYFQSDYDLLGFVDDGLPVGAIVNGKPILGGVEYLNKLNQSCAIFLGIGIPSIRKSIIAKIDNSILEFPNLIHPFARIHQPEQVKMERGNIIADGTIITTNVALGDFNLINLSSTIGHDVVIGNHCSVMPGVNISGGAHIEDEVYIGTGAKLIKATTVGRGATVGAGSVVNTDIPANETWAGVPAKRIQ